MKIVTEKIKLKELKEMAQARFGDMVKGVVDISRGVMAVDADLHADEEAALIEDGSRQDHLWGINLYPDLPRAERLEFDSMINLKPHLGNRTRGVDDPTIRGAIRLIVERLVGDE